MYHATRRHRRLTKDDVLKDLEELSSIGTARRPSDLPRHPRDAMWRDLNRIGQGMCKAFEDYGVEHAPEKKRFRSSNRTD